MLIYLACPYMTPLVSPSWKTLFSITMSETGFAVHGILQLCCAVNQFSKSVVREIRTLRSVGIGRG